MKKTLTTFIIIFIAFVTYGQTLKPDNLSFGSKAGESKSFNINTCSTCPWTIISIPEWATVDIENGVGPGTITVTTTEDNTDIYESRPDFVVIQLTAFDATLLIEQAVAGPEIELSTSSIEIPSSGIEKDLFLTSNYSWSIKQKSDWISVIMNGTSIPVNQSVDNSGYLQLFIKGDKNTSQDERIGTVTFSNGFSNLTLTVKQAGAVTSIHNSQRLINVSIYPNPSNGLVNVTYKEGVSIRIFNQLGNVIRTIQSNSTHSFELPIGIYLLEATDNSGYTSINKVIVE